VSATTPTGAARAVHSWQECPRCRATVYRWRDPALALPVGGTVFARHLLRPDGSPAAPPEEIQCPGCGLRSGALLDTPCRRWGLALPADCHASGAR
jgi:hypothetical protein